MQLYRICQPSRWANIDDVDVGVYKENNPQNRQTNKQGELGMIKPVSFFLSLACTCGLSRMKANCY